MEFEDFIGEIFNFFFFFFTTFIIRKKFFFFVYIPSLFIIILFHMARRIDITVPSFFAPTLNTILSSPPFEFSKSKHMLLEIDAGDFKIFQLTLPTVLINQTLNNLSLYGIGVKIGIVSLASIDYIHPPLNSPLNSPTPANIAKKYKKDMEYFIKNRKTSLEIYNEVRNFSSLNYNTWILLIGASVLAAGGAISNNVIITIAAVTVSPLMTPVIGMALGYRLGDYQLFKTAMITAFTMFFFAVIFGAILGTFMGEIVTYKWPKNILIGVDDVYNLVISIIMSIASGAIIGVSVTTGAVNPYIAGLLSAGLLPPIINASMLVFYCIVFKNSISDSYNIYFRTGIYNLIFYSTHVVTIIISINIVFILKKINKKFKIQNELAFEDLLGELDSEYDEYLTKIQKKDDEVVKFKYFFSRISKDFIKYIKSFFYKNKDVVTNNNEIKKEIEFKEIEFKEIENDENSI